jgi:hypothetical protein
MNEILEDKGLVKITEEKIHVTGLRGPLEDGWEEKVQAFADLIPVGEGEPLAHPVAQT